MTESGIKEVFFDWDGTFVDTETISLSITRRVLSDYATAVFGRSLDHQLDQLDMHGKDFGQVVRELLGLINEGKQGSEKVDIDIEDLRINKLRPASGKALLNARLAPGIGEVITELQDDLGVGIAVVSNSPRIRIQPLLDKHRYNQRIPPGRLFSAFEDVAGRLKEDPAIYLLATEKLNVKPQDSAAVEDSATGMRAVKRAGIGLRIGYIGLVEPAEADERRETLLAEGAQVVIEHMKELPAVVRSYSRPALIG